MSQTTNSMIDERIVEMKFDNKQFESGVKQTMSTLDRLKAALHFDTDTKGIEKIQNTFNNFNLQAPMAAVDAFSQKLSALQIFGKRIVENLADDFYGAIKKVEQGIKGVFNQINEGGARRAQNIEQAKFQLEGLGIAWEDIKGDIDYAVSGTAYGLDVAARAASQLVASNVQLGDDMKQALRGISGLAAMTGSSYEEISGIFTSIAGKGVMMAEDINRISIRGINAAAELAKAFGKTEEEIRDMASKRQITFKMFAEAMDNAFGEHAKDANKTYAGSLSNVNAALSRLGADIKTAHFETLRKIFVDLIPQLNAFKKAFKPVEDVIIKIEEKLGALVQKIINLVDVKKIVDKFAPSITKIGEKIVDTIEIISKALDKANPVLKTVKNLTKETFFFNEKMKHLENEANRVKEALSGVSGEGSKMSEELQAAKDIWYSGKYGNGQERIDALTAAGIDPKKTQAIINEFIQNGYDWDKAIQKVSETTSEAVDENSEKAEKLRKRVQTLATIFRNIKRTFKAVATSVTNVVSALFKSVSGTMEKFGVGDILIKVTGFIADMAEKFMITEEKAEKLTKPIALIQSIFKGIISIGKKVVSFIFSLVAGIGELAYSIGETIAGSDAIQSFIKSFTEGIKTIRDGIKSFIDTSKKSSGLKKFVDVLKSVGSTLLGVAGSAILKIVDILGWAINHLDSFFSTLADIFGMIFGGIFTAGAKIGDFFGSMFDSIGEGTFIEDFKAKFDFLFSDDNEAEAGQTIFQKAIGYIKAVFDWVINLFNQHTLDEYLVVIKELMSITLILESMMLIGKIEKLFKNGISLIGTVDKVLKSTVKVNKSIANLNNAKAIAQIAKVIVAFAAAVSLIMFTVVKTADYISKSAENAAAFEKVVDQVKHIMGIVLGSIIAIIASLKLADLAITMFTSKTKLHVPLLLQFGAFMFAIGYAIKQVVQAIVDLSDMDENTLKTGGTRLAAIGGAIGGFFIIISTIMAVINKFIGTGADQATKGLYAMSLVLISMALSIDILMAAVSWMGMMILGYGDDVVEKSVNYIRKMIRTIMGMLTLLIGATAFFSQHGANQDLPKTFLAMSALFLSIGVSLIGICLAINDLTLSLKLMPTETILAFTMVWITITTIMAILGFIAAQAKGMNENGKKSITSLLGIIFLLDIMISEIGHFANEIDNEIELGAVGAIMLGLIGIVSAMGGLMKAVGDSKPKPKAILSLAVAFAGLGAILVPLIFFSKQTGWDALSITAAMAGLVGILAVMIPLMKVIGDSKPKPKAIASLALAFAGISTILIPLIFLKGEDWPAYCAAMAGLTAVLAMMALVFKMLSSTTTPGQIVAIGGAFGIMAVGLAALGATLAAVSGLVDIEKLVALTFSIILLTAAITGIIVVANHLGGPALIGSVLSFALSMLMISAAVGIVIVAFAKLLEWIPNISDTLAEAGYQIGSGVIRFIKNLIQGVIDAVRGKLDSHSPSRVFMDIGYDCIEGFLIGIVDRLKEGVKILTGGLKEYIIQPICDFFDINSPSKVFESIGGYLGEGLEIGLNDKIKNFDFSSIEEFGSNLKDSLATNTSGIGDVFNGITDGLSFDSLTNIEGLDVSSLLGDTDITNLGNSLGMDLSGGINDGLKEGLMTIDPSTVKYAVEDLVADPSIYDTLKAAGIEGVTNAYEEVKRHEEFLAKNPTFEHFKNNIEDYYTEEEANLIRLMLNSGDEAMIDSAEKALAKSYVDQSKVDNIVLQYSRAFNESYNKYIKRRNSLEMFGFDYNRDDVTNIADYVYGEIHKAKPNANVVMHVQDEDGNTIKGVQSLFGDSSTKSVDLNLDNTTLSNNLNSVSGDISTVINAQGDKIAQKLEYINSRVNTFDNNQSSRINNLLTRMNQMESAINNIKIQLDTGALVGQLVGPMDSAIGEQARRRSRS